MSLDPPAHLPVGKTGPGLLPVGKTGPAQSPVGQTGSGLLPVGKTNPSLLPVGKTNPSLLPVGKTNPSLLPVGKTNPSRRQICRLLGAGAVAALTGGMGGMGPAQARPAAGWPLRSGLHGIDQRHLWIVQAGGGNDRGEALHCPFRDRAGAPYTPSVDALSWLFRDWRDDDQGLKIDVRLFDLLATVQTMLSMVEGRAVEIRLTSGYRTPERNRTLEGAAPNSQHISGRAADIALPGIAHARVADAAEIARAPGLGRYGGFTHLDVGPPGRRWRG
jgi:uncharacterized protein YcbK (DUF882 family)